MSKYFKSFLSKENKERVGVKSMSILNSERTQQYRVVGTQFPNEDGTSRQNNLSVVTKKSKIILKREPENEYDTNAVAVYADGKMVGYIGSYYAGLLAPKMDRGEKFIASVEQVGKMKDKYYLHIFINPIK